MAARKAAWDFYNSVRPILPVGLGAGAVTAWYSYGSSYFHWGHESKAGARGCLFRTSSGSSPSELIDYDELAKKPRPFATGHTAFSFGPGDNYFFAIRKDNTKSPLWLAGTHQAAFTSSQVDPFGGLYWYAYTPHGDELIAYKDADTKQSTYLLHRHVERPTQAPSYHSLMRWLGKNVAQNESSLRQSFVVFGPGASYFARNATTCTWHDLPQHLESIILEKREDYAKDREPDRAGWIPRIVALGANETWVAVWEDGRGASSIAPRNPILEDLADDGLPAEAWEHIVLSPHNANDFFTATKAGSVDFAFEAPDASTQTTLTSRMLRYMQLRAVEDGRTFEVSITINGKTKDWTISPTSNLREVPAD